MADQREHDLSFAEPASRPQDVPSPYLPPPGSPSGSPGLRPGAGSSASNPQATASLVLGIVSVVLSLVFVPAILGVILGIVGLARARRGDPPTGRGAAVTGIVLSVLGAGLGVVLAVAAVGWVSDLGEEIARETAQSAAPGDTDAGPEAEPFDPADYAEVDAARWESIAKDPEGAQGRSVVVYAEVLQFDSRTGDDRLVAAAGADQPGESGELTSSAVVVGEEALLADVRNGDVLRLHGVVTGSHEFETPIGGTATVPVLTVAHVEEVGFVDLGDDFEVGAPGRDEIGLLTVPVTVTSSASGPTTYAADLVAESEDGETTYGTAIVLVEDLGAGKTGTTEVVFFDEVPGDAVFRIRNTARYPG